MNNCLTYCGLVDARISASEKDLPVLRMNELAHKTFMPIQTPDVHTQIALNSGGGGSKAPTSDNEDPIMSTEKRLDRKRSEGHAL